MELWIATTNRGKLVEFEMTLEPLLKRGVVIKTPDDFDTYYPPEENGEAFLDNARIKARSMKAMRPGQWVMAEDSGLAVEGMNGLPGVHSARYAGPKASDLENRMKLLKIMGLKALTNRNAAFVCTMVVFDPKGQEHIFEGRMQGSIAKSEAGKDGFGYDAVFVPAGESKTLAELGVAFKNRISHRTRATEKLRDLLTTQL